MRCIVYVLAAFVAACLGKSTEATKVVAISENAVAQKTDTAAEQVVSNRPKTFDEINKILFDHLINGESGPFPVENDSGYYVLGMARYKDQLRRYGIFSEDFYQHEEARLTQCKNDLEALQYTGDTEDGWGPSSCFFDQIYWLRGQESPTGYEIRKLEEAEDSAQATMVFYDEYEGKKNYWDDRVYLTIRYRKEGDAWRVTEILRLPNNS